jgi:uncharacterized protein (TIGR02145 family)
MKTQILLSMLALGISLSTFSQKPSITLTFTADNNGQYVPLNSILIENLTQGGDTTLYAPDTVMVPEYVTGMNENFALDDNSFSLFQNYPNPMNGKTTICLRLTERNTVMVTVSDMMGSEVVNQGFLLEQGTHTFSFYPGRKSLYFFTARANQQCRTIKMFNSPGADSEMELCKLEYNGAQAGFDKYKSGNNLNNFNFSLGDQLRYTASSALGNRTIIDSPTGDQTYTFLYASDIPCPGITTITDIDGNVYNTVLIGSQCWMKENLKTTTFRNGMPIPFVTDYNAWSNLTTSAYTWYENNLSWKDSYGALYNWFATVDANNLCPIGWHIPTNDEWIALTDLIGGIGEPHGNELKSCRQVNSPLGEGCNTSEHPRWDEDIWYWNYGTDDYGFSGLPGGYRLIGGSFNGYMSIGLWWSSTEASSSSAWYRCLSLIHSNVTSSYTSKQIGRSVRCLKD